MSIQEEISSNINDANIQYYVYLSKVASIQPYVSEHGTLKTEESDINRKLQELDRIEDTYDREFLDRKNNTKKVGLVSKLGLVTTQDWVLALFFLSYVIFTIALFITIVKGAQNKIKAIIFVFCLTGVLGMVLTTMVRRYA